MPGSIVRDGKDISGTAAQRPLSGAGPGATYYATDTNVTSTWDGTAWRAGPGTAVSGAVAGTNIAAVEKVGVVRQTIITLAAESLTMTDATTAGCHGSQKIYDFPEGRICILGAHADLVLTAGAGGISDTAAAVAALGTAALATDNAALSGTEADLIASTTATLSGGIGDFEGANTAATFWDGSATAKDCFLNIAVPDAGSTGNDTMLVSGTVTLTWVLLGDD